MDSLINLYISSIKNCLPSGAGHIAPKYISTKEFNFFIPTGLELSNDLTIKDLSRAISLMLYKARNGSKTVPSYHSRPSWIARLSIQEYHSMNAAAAFIVQLKTPRESIEGYMAA